MQLHTMRSFAGSRKKRKRVGRGLGSGHGTTATRGMKGQRSRSGVSGLKRKGMRHLLLSVPKKRGFKSIHEGAAVVSVGDIEKHFLSRESVSPERLEKLGLVRFRKQSKKTVKILGDGTLTKKITVLNCMVSETARKKIEQAGGTIG